MNDFEGMDKALHEARAAVAAGEPPFGAVIVDREGKVVSATRDRIREFNDLTRHAEIEAVRQACAAAGPDLSGFTLYTTCEPCPMCFTAAWLARVSRIVWGSTMSEVAAVMGPLQRELSVPAEKMNELGGNQVAVLGGVRADECLALFKSTLKS
jgi:tRNA(Arg) A34 adenosine deaminase TadA